MGALKGQTILVTGGAKRIGRSICRHLHSLGAHVLIHYGGSGADAEQTAAECGDAPLFQANLERVDDIRRLFEEVEARVGRLDALVNNAARFTRADPLEVTEAQWDFIHSVNLKAYFFCAQQAALLMRRQNPGGAEKSSISARWARSWRGRNMSITALPKRRNRANSWTRKGLGAGDHRQLVAPGVIPFEEAEDPEIQAMARRTPAGRPGTGEDIAAAVAYFLQCSPFVTGQTLQVDGGLGLR